MACTPGNYAYALGVSKESLDLFRQLGDMGIALSFEGPAEIAYARKQLEQAALLPAHAEMPRQSIRTMALQLESTTRESRSATLRSALGSEVDANRPHVANTPLPCWQHAGGLPGLFLPAKAGSTQ